MDSPLAALHRSFDPEAFRSDGHRLIDQLADHLARCAARALPVLPWRALAEQRAVWAIPAAPGRDPVAALAEFARASNQLHHPGFCGHQVATPWPGAALADLVSALLNNGMAVQEMSPAATAIECNVVRWMCGALGLGAQADGSLVSGGSLGNLTALLGARQALAGAAPASELAILASDQAHYSVARAAHVLGLGAGGVVGVPVDAGFRLDPNALPAACAEARRRGRRPIAVVASVCSTATGSFDPLAEIADFCAREGLWLHADGAHGASAALSPKYRHLLAGSERADSVVWDAHKLLLMPSLVTGVLFRDGARADAVFVQDAPYLFARQARADTQDLGVRTFECTRPTHALKVWLALATLGEAVLAAHVEATFDLARRFAERIAAAPDFELAIAPQANIVCFRHLPRGGADLDAHQTRVRRAVVARGGFYLVQATLRGATWLRTTLANPRTTEADLDELLAAVRDAARGA